MKAEVSTSLPSGVSSCASTSRSVGSVTLATSRAIWLAIEITWVEIQFGAAWARHLGVPPLSVRARLLQSSCRRILRVFGLRLDMYGVPSNRGLLVCNHLSYLDILVLGAATPCVFISKSDVRRWPVFGWFAVLAGTLFVRRDRRADVSRMTEEIREALQQDVLVVLFPEGTSSGGATVLPFKSALLGAVESTQQPVIPAAISYALSDGDATEEVCYWKDMTLVPHLWNLLGKRTLKAKVAFGASRSSGAEDRKTIAQRLHREVMQLKQSVALEPTS